MKAYEIVGSFGMENLKSVERPDPVPGHGQVLLRMKAVSLNFRDSMMIRGHYNPRQPLPLVPCSDGVGEVVGVGEGVDRVNLGDRVATVFCQSWISGGPTAEKLAGTLGGPIDGTLSELMVLDAQGVVPVPSHLSDVEGATLPCAAVTAWSALAELGKVSAGDTVLVQGTGGVSIFALQFASILGARVIATSSSDEKLDRLRSMGVWATLNYADDPQWGKTVRSLTGGRGVDHIVEVGGAGTLAQSLRAITTGGTISVIGVLSGISSEFNIIPLLMQQLKLQGILVGSREGFERMNRAIEANEIRPVIDRVFDFNETPEAFAYMASGAHFGKVCIGF